MRLENTRALPTVFNPRQLSLCLLSSQQRSSLPWVCCCYCITGGSTHSRTQPPVWRSAKAAPRCAISNCQMSAISGPATTRTGSYSFSFWEWCVWPGRPESLLDEPDRYSRHAKRSTRPSRCRHLSQQPPATQQQTMPATTAGATKTSQSNSRHTTPSITKVVPIVQPTAKRKIAERCVSVLDCMYCGGGISV